MHFDPEQLMMFYIANQVASALVQALPPPNGNQWYNFFYKFFNLLVADFKTFAEQIPPPQIVATTTATKSLAKTVDASNAGNVSTVDTTTTTTAVTDQTAGR